MEIYRGSTDTTVTTPLPPGVVPTAVDIVINENGKDVFVFPSVEVVGGDLSVALPWHITRLDRNFYVNWSITYKLPGSMEDITVIERTYVQIVTPILPLDTIKEIAGLSLTVDTDNEAKDLERHVRFAIQSYTGQNFGNFYGVMRSTGSGSGKLALPAPLLEFSGMSFDGVFRPNWAVTVVNGGWALQAGTIEINSIKQAPPEWMLDRFDYLGKIHAPMLYGTHSFIEGVEYNIEGLWGYPEVPSEVQQAARLLTSDYACDESLWRERYITSVQAADWRFQFDPRAFTGTGNVQADQILSGYRRQTMVVI